MNFTSSDDEFCEEKSWSRWMNFQKLLSHLTQPSLGQMEQVLFTTSYTRIICFSHFLCLHLFLNLISWHLQLYHPVVYFFISLVSSSTLRWLPTTVITDWSYDWYSQILLALLSYFSKLNYCCFWYYTLSFERIVSYILFSSYVCTSTFNYPWQILKQYQYNFSGLLQLS